MSLSAVTTSQSDFLNNHLRDEVISVSLATAFITQCGGWDSFTKECHNIISQDNDDAWMGFLTHEIALTFFYANKQALKDFGDVISHDYRLGDVYELVYFYYKKDGHGYSQVKAVLDSNEGDFDSKDGLACSIAEFIITKAIISIYQNYFSYVDFLANPERYQDI